MFTNDVVVPSLGRNVCVMVQNRPSVLDVPTLKYFVFISHVNVLRCTVRDVCMHLFFIFLFITGFY